MRVTTMVPDVQYGVQQSQQSLATAMQQLTTGLRVNQLSDDPAASANMVRSLATSANNDQYTSNVSSVLSQVQTADSAISSIVTSLNTAVTLGTEGANSDLSSSNKLDIATQVASILTNVVAQANTSYQGVYVFAGTASSTPPFVAASSTYTSANGTAGSPLATTTHLTSGSVTSISDATTGQTMTFTAGASDTIATLASAITTAVTAGTLSAGTNVTFNASGEMSISTNSSTAGIVVSSNDASLGSMNAASGSAVANAYSYVGNSGINKVQIGDSVDVPTNLPGGQMMTSGANVIGSLNALITALQSGTVTQIGTAATGITSALNYVGLQRIPLDSTLSQLNSQDTFLSQEKLTLTTQQTALVGVNITQAATNLSQAELTSSAILAAAAKVLPQTLLDYLK